VPRAPPVAASALFARGLAWAALPAAAAALVASRAAAGPEGLFLADAAGIAVAVAVAAFLAQGARLAVARIALAAALLAAAHAAIAAAMGRPAAGALPLALLAAAVMVASAGLAALGRAGGAPAVAAGAISAGVLWAACGGLWWADGFAERLPLEARLAARQAVLDLDPFTAAAYGCAGLDRLRLPEVYEGTTIATLSVSPPSPLGTSAWWGGLGLAAAALAAGARRILAPRAGAGPPEAAS